jgi:hypothetical protein
MPSPSDSCRMKVPVNRPLDSHWTSCSVSSLVQNGGSSGSRPLVAGAYYLLGQRVQLSEIVGA